MDRALDKVAKHYTETLKKHGTVPLSVGWKDEVSQRLRFEKLVQVLNSRKGSKERVSCNDFGCGYGAMFHYLDHLEGVELVTYYGYDISEEMLGAANDLVPDPRAEFICAPQATREADYSFVSGTFNVKMETSDELWGEYVKDTLIEMAKLSRAGLAFNALTTYVDWKEEHLYYADPFEYFDFCKRNISRYVSLLHDYPLFEWTILVKK
jgi:SAM-dependent methyltransferase